MAVEIIEIEKDLEYTVNGKRVYKDINYRWIETQELTPQEQAQFAQHRAELATIGNF